MQGAAAQPVELDMICYACLKFQLENSLENQVHKSKITKFLLFRLELENLVDFLSSRIFISPCSFCGFLVLCKMRQSHGRLKSITFEASVLSDSLSQE